MPRSHAKITLTLILISDMCCDVPSDDSVEVSKCPDARFPKHHIAPC